MTINLGVPKTDQTTDLKPRITVIGVGGAGGNAINNMIESQLEGVDFVAANTDAQALEQSKTDRRVQLGVTITQGLGAGSRPDIGRAAAEEAIDDIFERIKGANMAFIAAGMGGGTGTGAAPVIARAAREQGILTVGVVTKPFQFEGVHRMRLAESGLEDLEQYVDTLIIIPNQNLFRVANEKTTFADAFHMADEVLYSGVRGVTDLMMMPGLINLDFADIRSVMSEMGKAMMGAGEAQDERRALDAAEAAISNPLLDDISMKGAKRVLINITGGKDMTLFEVDEAANRIRDEVDADAYIIFGSTFDENMEGKIRVSVVATGMESEARAMPTLLDSDGGATAIAGFLGDRPATVVKMRSGISPALDAPAEEAVAPKIVEETPENPVEEATLPAAKPEVEDSQPPAEPKIDADDAFIPSPPAQVEAEAKVAEPFAAVAMSNGFGNRGLDTSTKASLFERVTATGRAAKKRKEEPVLEESVKTEPIVMETPAEEPEKDDEIAGLNPEDQTPGQRDEDDLLDIPAFLRRQVN
jgi:cell division protein FtsZ